MPFDRAELLDEDLIWLVEILWAGRTWRWSSEPIAIATDSPLGTDTLQFDGGLDSLTVDEVLDALADTPQLRTIALSLIWPSDLAALVSEGHALRSATGELAVVRRGDGYEDRQVLIRGGCKLPEYGEENEPVALSIEEAPFEDAASLPLDSHRITRTTWPDASDTAIGAYYPIVAGTPGAFYSAEGGYAYAAGSPAYSVDHHPTNKAQTLLIADGRVAASDVSIVYLDAGDEYAIAIDLAVVHVEDALGNEVATVDVSGSAAALREAEGWWVVWGSDTTPYVPGEAMVSPYRPGVGLKTYGDSIRWWLDRSSVRVDRAAVAATAAVLRWPCAWYVDEPVVPLEFVQRRLLPALPVTLASGLDGLYLVRWRWDATIRDVEASITEGPGVVRIGRVTPEADEIAQTVRVKWGLDANTGEPVEQVTLTPNPTTDDPSATSNAYVRASKGRYPDADREVEVTIDTCWDPRTAANIAAWLAYKHAFERWTVTYDLAVEDAGWWRLGSVVSITSAAMSWTDRLALVQQRRWKPGRRLEVTFALLDPALTSTPTTGTAQTSEPRWSTQQ